MSNILAMDPTAEYSWSPKTDAALPEAERFAIKYHPLDMKDEALISDSQFDSEQKGKKSILRYKISMADIRRLELAIMGWVNLIGLDKKAIPFSKENIKCIPPEIRAEFIGHLTGRDRVKLDEDELEG